MEIKEFVKEAHRIAKEHGFWEVEKSIPAKLMLIVSELGEACEADRQPDPEHFDEEIADTFIRLADLCGHLNIDIEKVIERKMEINEKRPRLHNKRY